ARRADTLAGWAGISCAPIIPCARRPSPASHIQWRSDPPHTMTLRTVNATRYVTPLREGGSLPAIVEADDDGTYVVKFRGAGQGHKALIAELLGGELARALGLRVPEIVFISVDEALGS